jgi:hypothetical protein
MIALCGRPKSSFRVSEFFQDTDDPADRLCIAIGLRRDGIEIHTRPQGNARTHEAVEDLVPERRFQRALDFLQ